MKTLVGTPDPPEEPKRSWWRSSVYSSVPSSWAYVTGTITVPNVTINGSPAVTFTYTGTA